MESSKAEETVNVREWMAGRMKDLRLARGFTQSKLASALGIDPSRVSDIERGIHDIKVSSLVKYCGYIGIGLEELFKGCPTMKGRRRKADEAVIIIERSKIVAALEKFGLSTEKAEELIEQMGA